MRITSFLRESVSSVQKLINHDLNILKCDRYQIRVEAGAGGSGLARYNAVGGPGGDVYFVAKPSMPFSRIKKILNNKMKIRAGNGEAATKISLIGGPGTSKFIDVPVGTEVHNVSQATIAAKCTKPFKKYLIAKGGEGGNPRTGFRSVKGEIMDVELHLKLRTNIGLLGFPNAGKSTLMKALVPEKSIKIGEYAFTTLHPQVAFWRNSFEKDGTISEPLTISIADLPGIIEGASQNRGKGYTFLKHLEHADVILMVIDSAGFQLKNELDCPYREPIETVALLNREVENYDSDLLKKPVICVLNKVDSLDVKSQKKIQTLSKLLLTEKWSQHVEQHLRPRKEIIFEHVVKISASRGEINELLKILPTMREFFHVLKNSNDEDCAAKRRLTKF